MLEYLEGAPGEERHDKHDEGDGRDHGDDNREDGDEYLVAGLAAAQRRVDAVAGAGALDGDGLVGAHGAERARGLGRVALAPLRAALCAASGSGQTARRPSGARPPCCRARTGTRRCCPWWAQTRPCCAQTRRRAVLSFPRGRATHPHRSHRFASPFFFGFCLRRWLTLGWR